MPGTHCGAAVNEAQLFDLSNKNDYDVDLISTLYETASAYRFEHPLHYNNVVDALHANAKPVTDGRE